MNFCKDPKEKILEIFLKVLLFKFLLNSLKTVEKLLELCLKEIPETFSEKIHA